MNIYRISRVLYFAPSTAETEPPAKASLWMNPLAPALWPISTKQPHPVVHLLQVALSMFSCSLVKESHSLDSTTVAGVPVHVLLLLNKEITHSIQHQLQVAKYFICSLIRKLYSLNSAPVAGGPVHFLL